MMTVTSCPITRAYLECLRTRRPTSPDAFLMEDVDFRIDELLARADASRPDHKVLTLRSFFVLEALYHMELPRMLYLSIGPHTTLDRLAAGGRRLKEAKGLQFERSCEGMDQLLEWLKQLEDEYSVNDFAYQLDGRIDSMLREQGRSPSRQRQEILDVTCNLARSIKRDLIGELEPDLNHWKHVGSQFAQALNLTCADWEDRLRYASVLLATNSKTVIYPWSIPRNFQE